MTLVHCVLTRYDLTGFFIETFSRENHWCAGGGGALRSLGGEPSPLLRSASSATVGDARGIGFKKRLSSAFCHKSIPSASC